MRARFSAHKTKNVDFVVATYHPSCDAEAERCSIADSINSNWTKLKVTGTESGTNEHEGFVSFEAYLEEDGFEYCLAERSRFLFEERNIYVPSDKFGVWVVPPLVVTHSEIDWITEAIDEALLRVDQQLGL